MKIIKTPKTHELLKNSLEYIYLAEKIDKLHWVKMAEDGVVELYLDNHMLQTFRMCEAKGKLEFIDCWIPRQDSNIWFLDFGKIFHSMVEYYYIHRKDPNFDIIKWAEKAWDLWKFMEMDEKYGPHSKFHEPGHKSLGGGMGLVALMFEYAKTFDLENERFRVIGAELYFGKDKSVPLLSFPNSRSPFRLYLSGKIDLLMDDGHSIGPMDHKTTGHFRGNPVANFEVNDQMTGYVYATQMLLKQDLHKEEFQERECNKIWINSVQVDPVKKGEHYSNRFKRVPLFKTEWQLDQYKERQITTATRIFEMLINPYFVPQQNTMVCTNYMHRTCQFQAVHRQNSAQNELITLTSQYTKAPDKLWNPEQRDDDVKIGELLNA